MSRQRSEEHVDMTDRLRHLEEFLAPRVVAPRTAADDAIEDLPPLPVVERRMGRMYVVGGTGEAKFRPMMWRRPPRS